MLKIAAALLDFTLICNNESQRTFSIIIRYRTIIMLIITIIIITNSIGKLFFIKIITDYSTDWKGSENLSTPVNHITVLPSIL